MKFQEQSEKKAEQLLEKVKNDYDQIAKEFSKTREEPWSEFSFLKDYFKANDKILDFGCGNARFYSFLKEIPVAYYGVDFSLKMLEEAKKNLPVNLASHLSLIDNQLKLPFETEFFDGVLALAVFHHIPSLNLQQQALQEINRVLKKNGYLILSVWDFYHGRNRTLFFKNYLTNLVKVILRQPLEGVEIKDLFLPFKDSQGNILAQRFFHPFTSKELKSLISSAGFQIQALKLIPHGKNK